MKYSWLSALLLFVLSCNNNAKETKQTPAQSYHILTLTPRKAITYNDFPATIQGEQVVEIRPMVDGYLENIYVPEGSNVYKGELLFKISNPQYDQAVITAKAAIKSAVADVNAAQMDVNKVKPLVDKDIVSKYELESAQYTLQSKEAALAQAKATLANAETNVGYTYIRSPQSGVIGLIPYKVGALISSTSTDPLTTLSSTGNVYAYFSLNEKQLLNFSNHVAGATMKDKLANLPQVSLILADGTLYNQKGSVQTASGLIATTTGAAQFKAVFPNPMGIIQSGASATVHIPRTYDSVLLVPQSSTYQLQDKTFVYKLMNDNKIISTAVDVTATSDGQFYIIESGLNKGDKVVLDGFNLKDSTTIKPLVANTDSVYKSITDTTNNR